MQQARTPGEILRSAGKTTLVLQVFSAILLVALAVLYVDMSNRQAKLQDSIRENAMWSAYQLDREARTFEHVFDMAALTGDFSAKGLKALSQRFDILYSRVGVLTQSKFSGNFENDEEVHRRLAAVETIVNALVPLFDRINAGKPIAGSEITGLSQPMHRIAKDASDLLIYTNNAVGVARAENRDRISQLQHTSAIILILLLASVTVLIVTLRRQLNSLKAAGLGLELMTQELTRAYNAADSGNRAKSQFMATMGHEIRTPLNAILGLAELMESSRLDPADAANVRTIRSSGEALLDIINEILDYAKIEHGSLEIEKRPVDIKSVLDKSVSIISARAVTQGTDVVFEAPEAMEAPLIVTDPTRIRQVVLNLLSNAVKFTEKGRVTLRMAEHRSRGVLRLRVEIQDTGIGIDAAGREKLFKPFSQVDASISRRYGGTGLGLTICKQIIEQLGGTIGVESQIGKGSTFWFDIPVDPASAKDMPAQVAVEQANTNIPPLRILLVEDNQVNQQVATRFLNKLGQSADIANHGGEAVDMTANTVYDVILMDMQMPVMDGIEATRQIKARGNASSHTPIYAMTANASDEDRALCMEIGMNGFEPKPITLVRLSNLLARVAEERGMTFEPANPAENQGAGAAAAAEPAANVVTLHQPAKPAELADLIDPERRDELVDALGEEIYQELLQSFFSDARQLLSDLQAALASQDDAGIDAALHTIKGAASNVGLARISKLAQNLRHRQPNDDELSELIANIEQAETSLAA